MLVLRPWLIPFLLCSCVAGSLVDDVINALKDAVDCTSCHALLVSLQGIALLGDSAFVETITTVCTTLKVRGYTFCTCQISGQPLFPSSSRTQMFVKVPLGSKARYLRATCGQYLSLGKPPPSSAMRFSVSVSLPL